MPALLLLLLLLLLALPGCAAEAASSVDVDVQAPWPSGPTSFLLEASEFLSEEDVTGSLFWNYLSASTAALRGAEAEGGSSAAEALASSPALPLSLARTFLSPLRPCRR